MKVILPDNSELELPDGATGLDAARAIGPKLAEQAVLARVDGKMRDLRLPLRDGERVQFLTTRDKDDPEALYVRGLIDLMGLRRPRAAERDFSGYLAVAPFGSHRTAAATLLALAQSQDH